MNNEDEIGLDGEAQKFIIIFHKVFPEYHETRMKTEEGETNVNSNSTDCLVGGFFSKTTAKIRNIIQRENDKDNKGIKFLKLIANFFDSILDNSKNK